MTPSDIKDVYLAFNCAAVFMSVLLHSMSLPALSASSAFEKPALNLFFPIYFSLILLYISLIREGMKYRKCALLKFCSLQNIFIFAINHHGIYKSSSKNNLFSRAYRSASVPFFPRILNFFILRRCSPKRGF